MHLRQESWPDGTLTPKQAKEVKSKAIGDQKTFADESNGNGASTSIESSLFGCLKL